MVKGEHFPKQDMVAHTFNDGTQKVEAGIFLSLRPARSTEGGPGWSSLHREILT